MICSRMRCPRSIQGAMNKAVVIDVISCGLDIDMTGLRIAYGYSASKTAEKGREERGGGGPFS
jgi:hypothetical protein